MAGPSRGPAPASSWTEISTGALTAPFAFLGPSYDPQLRELRAVYTMASADDIYEERWLPTAVFGDALAGTDPLFRLISRYAEAASC